MLPLYIFFLNACTDPDKLGLDSYASEDSASPIEDSALPDTGDSGFIDTADSGTEDTQGDECDSIICVDQFPYFESNDTTTSAERNFDSYSCAPSTNESGPEIVYKITLPSDGFLALALDDWDQDVDVHLLEELDPDTCIDRGHYNAGALLPAGTYYAVVDSWVSNGVEYSGAYDLSIHHTPADSLVTEGLSEDIFSLGLYAFDTAWMNDEVDSFLYTIIDFSLPSIDKRQWTMDLSTGELLYNLYVTHGEGSGSSSDILYADSFSNIENSHQSSLGLMRTAEDYNNGGSMKLDGLEPDINDNVRMRYIVVHGADYATQEFIDTYGYLGRSWGCPAVDDAIVHELIDTVKEGSLYWSYYPEPSFLSNSTYLP